MLGKLCHFLDPCLTKKKSCLGLSRLDIPDPDRDPSVTANYSDPNVPSTWTGQWKSVTHPDEIEY